VNNGGNTLYITGAGNLLTTNNVTINASSDYSGATTVMGSTLTIAGVGALVNTSSLAITGATLVSGSTGDAVTTSRINSAATLTLGGVSGAGTFTLTKPSTGTSTQAFAGLVLSSGVDVINNSAVAGALSFAGGASSVYAHGSGGYIAFGASTVSFTNAPTDSTGVNVTNSGVSANDILIDATINNTDFVKAAAGTIAAPAYITNAFASGSNTTLTASGTYSGDTQSIRFNGSGLTLTITGTSTIQSGGIISNSASTETITGGAIQAASGKNLWIPGASSYNFTINSSILDNNGSGFERYGGNTVTLGGSNSFTGPIDLSGGAFMLGNVNALGSGTAPINIVGSTTLRSAVSGIASNRTISIYGGQALTFDTNGQASTTYGGPISIPAGTSNTVTISKSGIGTLYLTGSTVNTPNISLNMNAGTLDVSGSFATSNAGWNLVGGQGANATTINVHGNGTFSITGDFNFLNTGGSAGNPYLMTLNVSDNATFSCGRAFLSKASNVTGVINQTGGLFTAGVFDLNSSGSSATNVSATYNLSGGILKLTANTDVLDSNSLVNLNGGTLQNASNSATLNSANTQTGGVLGKIVVQANGGTLDVASGLTFTVGALLAHDSTLGGTADGGFTKTSVGKLVLTATNTYTGPTNINAGTINAGSADIPAIGGALGYGGNIVFNGGTLQFSAASAAADYSSRIKNSTGAIVIDTNAQSITFGGVLDSSNIGGITLNDSNATKGMLTLSAANTLSGTTTVTSGTLKLANGQALQNSIVAGGAGALVFDATSVPSHSFTFGALAGSTALTLADNGANAVALTVGNGNYSGSYSGTLGGAGSLTKTGTGTQTLSGSSSFSGGTTLSSGQLNMGNAAALGSGTLTIGGGTLDNTSAADITLSGNNPQAWNGDFTYAGSIHNLNLGTGAVTLGSNRQIAVSARTLTVGGAIGGGFGLTKTGTGAMILTGTNTFSGAMTVNGGLLQATGAQALPGSSISSLLTVAGGSTLTVNYGGAADWTSTQVDALLAANGAGFAVGSTLGFDTTNLSGTYNSNIAGNFGLSKAGANTLALGGSNSYAGNTTVSNGILAINNPNALSTGTLIIAGGGLDNTSGAPVVLANNPQAWNSSFSFVGSNSLDLGAGSVALGASPTVTVTSGSLTAGGAITGGFSLAKAGAGTLTLTGNNSYSGNTTVSAGALVLTGSNSGAGNTIVSASGTLAINNANALGSGTLTTVGAGTIDNTSGGPLTLANNPQSWLYSFTFAGSNSLNLGAEPVTLGVSPTVTVNASTLTVGGPISGGYNIAKSGSGTLLLTGSNNYTGGTYVNAGALLIGNANALGSGTLTMYSGATIDNVTGAPLTIAGANPIGWNGNFTFLGTNNLSFGNNLATNGGASSVTVVSGTLSIGGVASGNSPVKLGAGTLAFTGSGGYGNVTIGGGTLDITGTAVSAGTLTNGGTSNSPTLTVRGNGVLQINSDWNFLTTGTTQLTLNVQDNAQITSTSRLYLGKAAGTVATVNQSGGLVNVGAIFIGSPGAGVASSTYNLDGGILRIGTGQAQQGADTNCALNLNGGTLQSLTSGGVFVSNNTLAGTAGQIVVQSGGGTIDLPGAAYNLGISAPMVHDSNLGSTPDGGITKTGAGKLILTGSNTYTGLTTVNSGTLQASGTQSLPGSDTAGRVAVNNGGTLVVNYGGASDWTSAQVDSLLAANEPAFAAGASLGFDTTNLSGTYNSNIGGGIGVVKAGANSLLLGGSNSYSGSTAIASGTLVESSANSLPAGSVLTFRGGTLQFGTGAIGATLANPIQNSSSAISLDSNGQSFTIGVNIDSTNTGGLTKIGAGTVALGGSCSYTGATTVSGGTLVFALPSAQTLSGAVSGAGSLTVNGGTLTLTNYGVGVSGTVSTTSTSDLVLSILSSSINATGLAVGGTTELSYSGASNLNLNAGSLAVTGSGTLIKSGTGTVLISGNARSPSIAMTGGLIWVKGGTLRNDYGSGVAWSANRASLQVDAGATFDVWDGTVTVDALLGTGTVSKNWAGGGSFTIGANNGSGTFSGSILSGAGAIAMVKTGTGTQILTGSSNITGGTTISNGVLQLGTGTPGQDGSLAGNITNNATLAFDLAGSGTSSSALSGSGTMLVNGGGSLTLAGSSGYTGAILVQSGTLITTYPYYALGMNSAVTVQPGATMLLANGNQYIGSLSGSGGTISLGYRLFCGGNNSSTAFAGVLTGSADFYKVGTGTTTLSGNNNYSGGTTVSAGALVLSGSNSGSGNTTVSAGTLFINNPNALGSGTLILSGGAIDNTSGGAISTAGNPQMWNSSFSFAGSNTLDLGSGPVTLGASPTVTVTANTLAVDGSISGTFGLTKAGSGALALSGSNSYSGGTTVSAGTLLINNANALGSGTLTLPTGATIDNTSGAPLTLAGNVPIAWNGNFTFAGSNNLNFGANTASVGNSTVTVSSGTLSIGGVSNIGTPTKAGAGTLALTGTGGYGNFVIAGGLLDITGTATSNGSTTLGGTANSPTLTVRGNGLLQLNGDWNVITNSNTQLTIDIQDSAQVNVTARLFFGKATGAVATLNQSGGVLSVGAIYIGSSGGTNSIYNLNGGTLRLGSQQSNQGVDTNSVLNFNGGTLQSVYSGAVFVSSNTQSGTPGEIVVKAGGGIVDTPAAAYSLNISAPMLHDSTLGSTPDGGIDKTGIGKLILSATNTFSGATIVNSGTLQLSNSLAVQNSTLTINAGVVVLDSTVGSHAFVAGALSGTGSLALKDNATTPNPVTLTVGGNNFDATFAGVLSGSGALTKTGTGTQALTGANSYTGATTINAGTLQLGNGGTTGSLLPGSAITDNGTLAINRSNTVTQGTDFAATVTGAGGIVQAGAGTTVLSGSNSYSGGTTVSSGTLKAGNANALGTGGLTVNGGTLNLNGNSVVVTALGGAGGVITNAATGASTLRAAVASGTSAYAGAITSGSGAVVLTKSGTGTLILSGSLTMAGLNANNGATQVTQSGSIAAVNVAAGATLALAAHTGSNYNVLNVSSLSISGFASALSNANNAGVNSAGYTPVDPVGQTDTGVLTDTGRAVAQAAATIAIEPSAPEAVPEPGTLGMLLAGAFGLLGFRRRGKSKIRA